MNIPKQHSSVILFTCQVLFIFSGCTTTFTSDAEPLTGQYKYSQNTAVCPEPRGERWLSDHEKREARLQKGNVDILLIGDSITNGWKRYPEVFKKTFGNHNVVNLGHPADKTENIIWRLYHHKMNNIAPHVAVVLAGTNNTNGDEYSAEQIAEGVQAIVQLLRVKLPQTKILLLGIFPRGSYEQRLEIKNGLTVASMNPQWEKIERVNQIIKSLADGEHVVYQNINHAFLDENGALSVTVMPDMLHPTEKGYEIWGKAIMPALKKMMDTTE